MWAQAGVAAVLGLVSFAVVSDGAFAVTQRIDPTLNTLVRNRWIASGLGTIAGLLIAATKSPLYGATVAAGALAAGAGAKLTFLLGSVLDVKAPATAQPAAAMNGYTNMQAVYGQSMNAVYGQSMNAVYGQSMQGYQPAQLPIGSFQPAMGDLSPSAPWSQETPFGY